jgi:glutathione synthase/RimK-type ligase-like ATP-grasp enzyme
MIVDAEPSAAEGLAITNESLAPPSVMDIEDATKRVLNAMAAKSGKAKKENASAKKTKKEATTPVSKPQTFHDSSDDDDEDEEDVGLPTKKPRNTKPKTIAKTAEKKKKAPVAKKAPMKVQHEKSRTQFLVRTVPSKQFKYGKGCAYPSEELARKAADKHALRH